MPASPFRILCTGDVHLGRRPSRVPIEEEQLSVEHVWESFVEAAINQAVDAVVLTGDLVDTENKMYEALEPLERGLQRLLNETIPVVAVAGNHDFDVFPGLVGSIEDDNFHLLGQGGTWDEVTVSRADGSPVRFVGWSFPDAAVPRSPLDRADMDSSPEPTVGVLHCDAGRSAGHYAPVERNVLARAPVDAWLLGHIHKPTEHRKNGQLQLYPGSLQPLDPGETGMHGAWLVEVGKTDIQAHPVSLATLRYARLSVDVTDKDDIDAVKDGVMEALRRSASDITDGDPQLQHIAYRLIFEGRTDLNEEIEQYAREIERDLTLPIGSIASCAASIESYVLETKPSYDLLALADGDGPRSLLARLLHDLESGASLSTEAQALMKEVQHATRTVHQQSGYDQLQYDDETRASPSSEERRQLIIRQGYQLLDRLHAA